LGNDGYQEIKDATWQQVNSELGEIKFRKKNSARRAKRVLKTISFLVVASVSGGLSGAYVVKNMYDNKFNYSNTSLFQSNGNTYRTVELSKSSITRVAESIGPAVVGISSKLEGTLGEKNSSGGSGIIFDSRGYIVTNYHVIQAASKVSVKLSNGKVFAAKYVGSDVKSDLVVLKIDAVNLPIVSFGDSSKVKVGDVAIAIGNPLGEEFQGTVTAGIISAVNRKIQNGEKAYKILQTDAAISLGNSGGALCNEIGEVIGINNIKIGFDGATNIEGLGFAISINEANEIIKQIMKTVAPTKDSPKENTDIKPIMGIKAVDAVPGQNNVIKGAYVKEVVIGSEAALAGIHPTDIIVQIDEIKISNFKDFDNAIKPHKINDSIKYKLFRTGEFIEINVVLSK
jgi:serine protease Do